MKLPDFCFAWDGDTRWDHLLVLEARGHEALSEPFRYTIELVCREGESDVDPTELCERRATLRIETHDAETPVRFVHGVVMEADEIDVEGRSRIRLELAPITAPVALRRASRCFVGKTLRAIVEATLSRIGGLALQPRRAGVGARDGWQDYEGFVGSFEWRVARSPRIDDAALTPYVAQYDESDVDFVARLLEHEGITTHFEHHAGETVFVLSDHDGGLLGDRYDTTLAPLRLHHDIVSIRRGGRVRPAGVRLDDYDWRRPDLEWTGRSLEEDRSTTLSAGGFSLTPAQGEALARVRASELSTETRFTTLETSARTFGAGGFLAVEHPSARFAGRLLAVRIHVELRQRESFAAADGRPAYRAVVEAVAAPSDGASGFRPPRRTRRPFIAGTQTAVVTAEPGQSQEINVGGESDLGCVRLLFHWDRETTRHAQEPTSHWVRVSQMFAGGKGHGALFHPRVGDEVLVEHLEGDPDRPVVVGRVYNGRNLAPEDATARPTYSCIKSMTSPFNGNYNMIAFDDLQGEEKFIVHVAKDYIANVGNNSSRFVMNLDEVVIKGNQGTHIHGRQEFQVEQDHVFTVMSNQRTSIAGSQTITVVGAQDETIGTRATQVKSTDTLKVGALIHRQAGAMIIDAAPMVTILGSSLVAVRAGTAIVAANGACQVKGGTVNVAASGDVTVTGATVKLNC
jgi:type VI secretion system secreted protein VgrG